MISIKNKRGIFFTTIVIVMLTLFFISFTIIKKTTKQNTVETGSYILDVNVSFQEAFFNGTINGETNAEIASILQGATFPDIEADINQKAQKMNAQVSI